MTATVPSVGRSGLALSHLVLPRLPPAWAHVTRVVLAAWLALYVAYFVQLDSPYWAATTVLTVASPVRGALFSKSQWRILGTIVGAVAMVTLIAIFPQQPVLFMAGVAVWLGIFTFIASLLRSFRAYGAVLAGFTVSLIAFGRIDHPATIIYVAFARVSAVTIGVLSIAFVSLVFHGAVGDFELERRVASVIGAVARLLRDDLRGQPGRSPYGEQARISLDLTAVEEDIESASVESFDIRRRANALRIGVAELFGALVAGSHTIGMVRDAVEGMPGHHAAEDPAVAILDAALTQVVQLSRSASAAMVHELLRVIQAARDELGLLLRDRTSETYRMALADARELLDRLSGALRPISTVREEATPGHIQLRAYLGWHTAFRNGLRAMIAMDLGSLFWIATAWPSGGEMLAMLGLVCGLLETNPSAAAASIDFAKGVVLATVCAFVCKFGLLTHVTGFPLLALSLLPFLAGGAYASTKPHLASVVGPLLIFFMPLVGATNPTQYDLAAFLNFACAYICGSICAVLTFRIVLPPNPALNIARLCGSIADDVERLGGPGPTDGRLAWEHLQHQKLVRLIGRLKGTGAARYEAVLEEVSAAIGIGSAAIQVRAALAAGIIPAPAAPVAEGALHLLGDLRSNAGAAASRSTEVAWLLADRSAGAAQSDELLCVAGAFQRIGTLIERHARFFQHPGAALWDDVPC
jgi:uncharacterized membrane protein YccC